jgi:hypothetical protein
MIAMRLSPCFPRTWVTASFYFRETTSMNQPVIFITGLNLHVVSVIPFHSKPPQYLVSRTIDSGRMTFLCFF